MAVRHCKSSTFYERTGQYDLWTNLGLQEVSKSDTEIRARVEINTELDEGRYIIEPVPLKFKDRVKILFKGETPIRLTHEYTIIEDKLKSIDAPSGKSLPIPYIGDVPPSLPPSPGEQKAQADDLVLNFPRQHSQWLIDATKALPEPDEFLVQLPRKLKPGERQKIKKILLAIVNGKPVPVKVSIEAKL